MIETEGSDFRIVKSAAGRSSIYGKRSQRL